MDTSLHLLLMYLCYALGCTKITPDSYDLWIPVELGKEFTATCNLPVDSRYTADDIEWQLGDSQGIHRVPRQFYTRINETAVSVTVNISSTKYVRLICEATKKSFSYEAPCRYGIFLQIGYPPLKPENLTCIALQDNTDISPELKCSWDQVMRDPLLDTTYTLYAKAELESKAPYNVTCKEPLVNSCTVNLSTFPIHMELRVWVTVENALGSELSDSLLTDALHFVKPKPPFNVQVLDEANFSTSLMVTWKHPIDPTAMKLYYVIRYCRAGCSAWTEVPENITHLYTESFRLQSLQPYTKYVVQMRCIQEHHHGYWSDWSPNSTAHTPEARPASKPDLWRIIQSSAANRTVQIIWKNPVKANGKILRYDLELSRDLGISERHQLSSDVQRHEMRLPPGEMALIEIKAANSAGVSPKATLSIPRSDQELPGVEHISWSVRDGLLWLEWSPPPSGPGLSEYLLEWVSIRTNARQSIRDWQRVSANVNSTFISGDLEPYTQYNISVYPMYSHPVRRASTSVRYSQAGRPVTIAAYTQQGPPLEVPTAKVTKNKKTSAELTWEEIPVDSQQGFITNYTIFYRTGKTEKSVTVEAGVYSLVLTDLASESDYVLHIMASTVAGSKNGSNSSFKTRKYGEGEVEVIVVVVCLSFLFLTVFIIMCCLRKREVIKELLWPQVPDPYDSSIANWSPDFQIKADMPKEDVSVVEVDVCDGKSLYEEDKAILPLKKDKYLSEEHSSGIGGSSCMSSPRHSVSDSDEGDSGQTTASTVQYSSVVASGYKGQTPNHQPPVFARSESTQPLLDCEEHPEHEGSGHSRNSYFRRGRGLELGSLEREEPNGTALTFCPMEEETSPIREDSPTSTSCYMPQQNGYRPQ